MGISVPPPPRGAGCVDCGGRNAGVSRRSFPSALSFIICATQMTCNDNSKLGDEGKGKKRKGALRSEKPDECWPLRGNTGDGREIAT